VSLVFDDLSTVAGDHVDDINGYVGEKVSLDPLVASAKASIYESIDSHLALIPFIRFTGVFELPPVSSINDTVSLKFEIMNIGGSEWKGWFIINFVDSNGKKYQYNTGRTSAFTILPGAKQMVEYRIPLGAIITDSDITPITSIAFKHVSMCTIFTGVT
jgi:hypothetical protein